MRLLSGSAIQRRAACKLEVRLLNLVRTIRLPCAPANAARRKKVQAPTPGHRLLSPLASGPRGAADQPARHDKREIHPDPAHPAVPTPTGPRLGLRLPPAPRRG